MHAAGPKGRKDPHVPQFRPDKIVDALDVKLSKQAVADVCRDVCHRLWWYAEFERPAIDDMLGEAAKRELRRLRKAIRTRSPEGQIPEPLLQLHPRLRSVLKADPFTPDYEALLERIERLLKFPTKMGRPDTASRRYLILRLAKIYEDRTGKKAIAGNRSYTEDKPGRFLRFCSACGVWPDTVGGRARRDEIANALAGK